MATAPAKTTTGTAITVANYLEQGRAEIEKALPEFIRSERFIRVANTEVRNNVDLVLCEPLTIVTAIMKAAQLGLEVGKTLGQAFLVPYGKTCELIVGYKGYMNLVRRSGEVSTFYAAVVNEGDDFQVTLGTEPDIKHKPTYKTTKPIFYYAVCKFKDGSFQFEVMSKVQIEEHRRKHSRQPNSKGWNDSFDEMAKKTVIRRLIKMLPISIEDPDSDVEENRTPPTVDVEKFKAISAAPDTPSEVERDAFLGQLFALEKQCQAKGLNVDDVLPDGFEGASTEGLLAMISVLKERLNAAT